MYQNRFTRILSVVIAVQMAVPPFVYAQNTPQPQRGSMETAAAILQGTSSIFSNITQAMQQQAATLAAQNQANALKAEMNPQNCGTVTQPVACVSEIFPQCQILNTFPNLVEPSECTDGVDGSSPNAAAQAGVAAGYYAHFSLMENEYRLKGLESNNTSNVGLGCLNAKADELQRKLKLREDEIDNLINKMQKEQDAFKAQAERERNTIDESMALLEGGNYRSDRGRAVLEQNTVRFENAFKNNAACAAVLDNEAFKSNGNRAGFKGIEAALGVIANRKETGGTSFSAMEFNNNTAERIEADVRKIASFAAREIQSRGDSVLTQGFRGLPSNYGLATAPSFTAALLEQTKAAELDKADILRQTQGVIDDRSQSLLSELENDTVDFEFVLTNWERDQKNSCLTRRGSNIDSIINDRLDIIDPNGSKEANRFSDNAYRTFLKSTLERSDISIEKKMELIAAEERRNGNSRFIVDTQTSTSDGETTIKASRKSSPANFIKLHVENCKQQFEQNTNTKGVTNRQLVTQIRKVRSDMMTYRRTLAGKVQKALVDRVLNCQDSGTANAVGVATCSSRDLSTGSPNFCVKRANACATNMRQCLTAAENEVKKVTAVRDTAVAQYKGNIARHEENLRKMYLLTENITSLDGLNIAASLKQNLVLPTNLKFHIDQDKRKFVRGLEAMEVQDPDEYFDLMKQNLTALKTEVAKQNRLVMNGLPGAQGAQRGVMGHIENIKRNMENVIQNLASFKNACQQSYQAFNRGVQQANQEAAAANAQRQEELREYCLNAQSFANPTCGDVEELGDLATTAARMGDSARATEFRGFRSQCRSFGSESESGTISQGSFVNLVARSRPGQTRVSSVEGYCALAEMASDDNCKRLNLRTGICSADPAEALRAMNAIPTNERTAYRAAIAACTTDSASTNCTTRIGQLEICVGTDTSVRQDVMQQIAEGLRNTEGLSTEETLEVGENRSSVCAAFDNSGAGAIGKALQDVSSQFGAGIVNGLGAQQ